MDDEKEQIYFDNYNPSDLENVIERQKKIINHMKSKKIKKLHSILPTILNLLDIVNYYMDYLQEAGTMQ